MEVKIFTNNPWEENTLVLYDDSREAAVVDCGCFTERERAALVAFLEEKGLTPTVLLNTHLHPDHIFGNEFMKSKYHLETQASWEDDFLIENAVGFAAMLGISGIAQPPFPGTYLQDGDTVVFGHTELEVIAIPGHSPGGLCFYNRKDKILITGDVLFAGSVGRSDFPGGDGEKLLTAIRERLFVLADDVKVIPGHGQMTTIGKEKRFNPFFR